MMKRSREFLKDHPVNQSRIKRGLPPVSSVWFWGEGRKPNLTPFEEKYHVKGSVVSAVDLIKGIGICAGLNSIDVEGATGTVHTNFEFIEDCMKAHKNIENPTLEQILETEAATYERINSRR